ncbi:MAG: hypothetical protein V1736_06865 [Pseudomonadota bacterium]
MAALSVGDVRTGTIPSLLPSQKHYLKVYKKSFVRTFFCPAVRILTLYDIIKVI